MPEHVSRKLRLQGIERREVTLILRHEATDVKHYCMFCDSHPPLFAARGRVIGVIYGNHVDDQILIVPCGVPCRQCGTIYFISGLSQ